MSELKAFNSERIYWAVEQVEREAGDIDTLHLDDNQFYFKSEADKVIAHQKYKRCLAMASRCFSKSNYHFALCRHGENVKENNRKSILYLKWRWRWLAIARKFKEGRR